MFFIYFAVNKGSSLKYNELTNASRSIRIISRHSIRHNCWTNDNEAMIWNFQVCYYIDYQ